MGLMYFWDPLSLRGDSALFRILVPIGGAVCVLIGILGIALFFRLRIVCEITSGGMNAPDVGGCVFKTFIPWNELVNASSSTTTRITRATIALRDRSGRRRFLASRGWLICATPADRARIFRALPVEVSREGQGGKEPGIGSSPAHILYDVGPRVDGRGQEKVSGTIVMAFGRTVPHTFSCLRRQ